MCMFAVYRRFVFPMTHLLENNFYTIMFIIFVYIRSIIRGNSGFSIANVYIREVRIEYKYRCWPIGISQKKRRFYEYLQ